MPSRTESGIIPEREVVAVGTVDIAGHEHVVRVKLADGSEESREDVISAIEAHEAHYFMAHPQGLGKMLVEVRQCPDCASRELVA